MTGFSVANQKGYRALIRVSEEPIKVNLHYSENSGHILCFPFVDFLKLLAPKSKKTSTKLYRSQWVK